jgi:hypothetical protein
MSGVVAPNNCVLGTYVMINAGSAGDQQPAVCGCFQCSDAVGAGSAAADLDFSGLRGARGASVSERAFYLSPFYIYVSV